MEHIVGLVRHARLKSEYGSMYPELQPDYWLPAWQVATRLAERRWREIGPEAMVQDRLLSDDHFDFRGGKPRPMDWYVTPERLSDPNVAELQLDLR
jgi:hypothetical protein